jgi:rod shape-determining protein MreD
MAFNAFGAAAPTRIASPAARLLPVATTLAAMVISLLPVEIPGYAALTPAFVLMAAYHWTIYRPELLPPLALFLIGMTADLLTGAPPGVSALVLLFARASLIPRRRWFIGRGFPFVWAGFTLLTAAAMLLFWAFNSLFAWTMIEPRSTVFRAVLTISLFPVASFVLGRSQRALMGAG